MTISSNFASVPEEVLLNIFDYAIHCEKDFYSIRNVCKQWKRVAGDQKIVDRLLKDLRRYKFSKEGSKTLILEFGKNASIIHFNENSTDDQFLKDISNSISNVVKLKFGFDNSVSIDSVLSLLSKTPKLKSFSCLAWKFNKEHFEKMSEYCPELTKLNLLNCTFDNEALLASSKISKLVSLNVGNNPKINEQSLIKFSAARKGVTCLKIFGIPRLSSQGMVSIVKNCSELRKISLKGLFEVDDETLVQLAHSCKKLKCIDLTRCFYITDKGVSTLFNSCPDLFEYRLFETKVSTDMMQSLEISGKKVLPSNYRVKTG
jgi:F-box-like